MASRMAEFLVQIYRLLLQEMYTAPVIRLISMYLFEIFL